MFVFNPDKYMLPDYKISPFSARDIALNFKLFHDDSIDIEVAQNYLNHKIKNKYELTINGKEGIHLALKSFNLQKADVITILTTSQNYYISSCVTKEIEKFCKWNREILPETKILFVNHEFGTIYPHMDELVVTGLPIIEDCCTTFFSQDEKGLVGKYGDFAIYSFPKYFPIQIGGLLVNNKDRELGSSIMDKKTNIYVQKIMSRYLDKDEELLGKRQAIYGYALNRYSELGFSSFFIRNKLQVPSVMMLKNNGVIGDLPALKIHLWNHGIQSSVFYGEDAFFIPSHQNLSEIDIEYFFQVLKNAIKV